MAVGLGMLGEEGLGSMEKQAAWRVFSASESSWGAAKGNILVLVPPKGFYSSPAAGLGSEIRKKENQGVIEKRSGHKGINWKCFPE